MIIPAINGGSIREGKKYTFPSEYSLNSPFSVTNALFASRMERAGFTVKEKAMVQLSYQYSSLLDEEAYLVDISEKEMKIFARGEKGFQYGLNSIYQMLLTHKHSYRPMVIEDYPRFAYRSLMVDVCRHFFSKEELLKIIDQCSLVKINHLHLHLSDDQGFRLESRLFPNLNQVGSYRVLSPLDPLVSRGEKTVGEVYGGYYSQEDIQELVQHGLERNVEIVPEIELPGHASAMVASYPELSCDGKKREVKNQFGVFKSTLCPWKESTYVFLEKLLEEISSLFPCIYFHLGGDECSHLDWEKNPECLSFMKKHHLPDCDSLHAYFMNHFVKYLNGLGKKAILWNDSFQSHSIDESAIGQYWNELNPLKNESFKEIQNGRKFIFSNMNAFYFDYSYEELPLRATLLYEPQMKNEKVADGLVLGLEAPCWSEWLVSDEELEKHLFPRLLALSEAGWSKKKTEKEFLSRVKRFMACSQLQLLQSDSFAALTKKKEDALQVIADNMKTLGKKYHIPEELRDEDNVTFLHHNTSAGLDQRTALTYFFQEKLAFGYTKKDINKVVELLMKGETKNE